MMIKSSVMPRRGFKSGAAARPTFFGCRPQSTKRFKSPSWMNSELAPMPPSRFRSVSFMWRRDKREPAQERERSYGNVSGTRGGCQQNTVKLDVAGPGVRDDQFERREHHVDFLSELVDTMEAAMR